METVEPGETPDVQPWPEGWHPPGVYQFEDGRICVSWRDADGEPNQTWGSDLREAVMQSVIDSAVEGHTILEWCTELSIDGSTEHFAGFIADGLIQRGWLIAPSMNRAPIATMQEHSHG